MREFELGTEKQFPGLEGDMLHRLVRTTMQHENRKARGKSKRKREASPDFGSDAAASGSGAAASGSGAAASGSGAAASGSEAAGNVVRRSTRALKPKQIFDPSVVKRERQGD